MLLLSGMTCGMPMPNGGGRHAVVAGMSSSSSSSQNVHCVDLHRDLKIVSSHSLIRDGGGGRTSTTCVSDVSANVERNSVVVGCADGTIRLLDSGRSNVEVAKARAQIGGVARVAVSGNLICASGYSSQGSSSRSCPLPYPYPAPHVLLYDVRYLGRGGTPHAVLSAGRGGPRFVNFLPDGDLLVGSGQTFGGFEVISPFRDSSSPPRDPLTSFFQPELSPGESMTVVNLHDGWDLHVGTSYGRVLRYGLDDDRDRTKRAVTVAAVTSTSTSTAAWEGGGVPSFEHGAGSAAVAMVEPLDVPPFAPTPPALSIEPAVLCSSHLPSSEYDIHGWNVFNSYVMGSDPILSSDRPAFHPRYPRLANATTLGALSVPPPKRLLSKTLRTKLETSPAGVFPTASLDLNGLLTQAEPVDEASDSSRVGGCDSLGRGEKPNDKMILRKMIPNPNKLIYSAKAFAACYDATANPRKAMLDNQPGQGLGEDNPIDEESNDIPRRYRLMIRPPFYKVANFDYSLYNDSGLWVGWDYAPSFANSFACSVLALLYFVEEIRTTALHLQLCSNEMSIQGGKSERRGKYSGAGVSITAELGLLFHLIESLSANGMIPSDMQNNRVRSNTGQVKAFVPSNFISTFMLLPEATNLALLDGVAGSAEIARRPEALYRFLMQYIERELEQLLSKTHDSSEKANQGHLIYRMQGIGFLSVIEYATGKPKISTSIALTVDLSYDQKLYQRKAEKIIRFGEVLRFSLCKEAPLRAWCEETRAYEAVVQRKIATNLPSLLSLSCCCAGRKAELGLQLWQQQDSQNWLPEYIEIQIETDKSITVKELAVNEDGAEEWMTFKGNLTLPESIFDEAGNEIPQDLPIKKSYRLEAIISFVRTSSCVSNNASQLEGHHVVHVRTPNDFEIKMLNRQLHQMEKSLDGFKAVPHKEMTLMPGGPLEKHRQQLADQIGVLKEKEKSGQWVLFNGFVVTRVNTDDVRSFNAKFKEPSVVIFRELDSNKGGKDAVIVQPSEELSSAFQRATMVPLSAMETTSISNNGRPKVTVDLRSLPAKGDLVAIDAEFVCVQPEQSLITSSGSKEMISEPRNALARLSVINCQTNEIIIDDYVLPLEPVVDYLTRFSGIRQSDLDANSSPHHLVTPHEAYLKVRLLMERGCVFVGHGLSQDFRVINICIPPNQIIDTAEIFHQPNQRYISLRYLTNSVLGRDMQQEVHDSIEDARAAHELYIKALNLKKEGKFNEFLTNLYATGHTTQFKLGVETSKNS